MIDQLIRGFDKALRTALAPAPAARSMPGAELMSDLRADGAQRAVIAMMRVNHAGEVCAQALYHGQALVCRDPAIRCALERAAWEETEHLGWTERRLAELGGRKSVLNPVWYSGAFAIGFLAGKLGDEWSLGFLAETERQVEDHLDQHLACLPAADNRSRRLLEQMKFDEAGHAALAVSLGARKLPSPVPLVMAVASRVMTTAARYL